MIGHIGGSEGAEPPEATLLRAKARSPKIEEEDDDDDDDEDDEDVAERRNGTGLRQTILLLYMASDGLRLRGVVKR